MIISVIQSKRAHWSCYSSKFKAPADFSHHTILAKRLSLNYAAIFFHCAIRRRLLSKGIYELFINFLGRHSFLTKVLDNRSDFRFLHFANVSHPPLLKVLYISNQAWPHALHTLNVLQLDQMTD